MNRADKSEKFTKKGFQPFLTHFTTAYCRVTETDCRFILGMHAMQTHDCWSSSCNAVFEALSPTSQCYCRPPSLCFHANTDGGEQWKSGTHAVMQQARGTKRDGKSGKIQSGKKRRVAREKEEHKPE